MHCDDLDPLIEAVADGSLDPGSEARAHLETCARCRERLAAARDIERTLSMRVSADAPAGFVTAVMLRIGQERWQAERAFDLGFNLAVAAGVLFMLAGAAGAAWSLGLLTVTIDVQAVAMFFESDVAGRALSQMQTVVLAAGLLTLALVLWWWAEADA